MHSWAHFGRFQPDSEVSFQVIIKMFILGVSWFPWQALCILYRCSIQWHLKTSMGKNIRKKLDDFSENWLNYFSLAVALNASMMNVLQSRKIRFFVCACGCVWIKFNRQAENKWNCILPTNTHQSLRSFMS